MIFGIDIFHRKKRNRNIKERENDISLTRRMNEKDFTKIVKKDMNLLVFKIWLELYNI